MHFLLPGDRQGSPSKRAPIALAHFTFWMLLWCCPGPAPPVVTLLLSKGETYSVTNLEPSLPSSILRSGPYPSLAAGQEGGQLA